ncbi:MAG: B9 domain-containing protein [archaeon]|nr:B9 domain-containing protein [archaeon]
MQNQFATPQIYIFGRIVSGVGFPANELFVKYKFLYGVNFNLINGSEKGDTYQSRAFADEEGVAVYFDQPLFLNLSCRSIKGWPKLYVEVWGNDPDGKTFLAGYGTGFIPAKSGFTKFTISCWRPTESLDFNYGEELLCNIPEFYNKEIVYSTEPKFEVTTVSGGQIIVEIETIFKDFALHGIKI